MPTKKEQKEKKTTFSILENCCRRLPAWALTDFFLIGVTITHIVSLPLSFITYVCVDCYETTMLVDTVVLYSNNNSAARCSYSALDVYPTSPCVYAQYPVVWNTSTRGSLGKSATINFLVLTMHTETITDETVFALLGHVNNSWLYPRCFLLRVNAKLCLDILSIHTI